MLLGPGAGPVLAAMEDIVTGLARAELESLLEPGTEPRVPLDLVTQTVVAGVTATMRWWVGQGMVASPEQVDAWLLTLIAPGLRSALPPSKR